MRYAPLAPALFTENRARLAALLPPKSLAILNANDILPTNADGSLLMRPNSDLYYLTGVEQEETKLLIFPDADDEKLRLILFLREPNEQNELWEGHKLRKEEAQALTGIVQVKWLSEFPGILRRVICEAEQVFLNTNEHRRAHCEVETRDDRFIHEVQRQFPLHTYRRLAPLLHQLRLVKSRAEIQAIERACQLTEKGFRRVLRTTKPGQSEADVEAEFAYEFTRGRGRFAYEPIVASGKNACCLHYQVNGSTMKAGQLVLLDVGAALANYNSDMTRTIPVSGKFTRRQRQIYDAVLRVLRAMTAALAPGVIHKEWQKKSEAMMTEELLKLGLLKPRDIKKQTDDAPAVKKYFMHGLGHPIGLDVHDVGDLATPMQDGWVYTVEPGIYIPEEEMAIRLEDTVLITAKGPVNLMADIPLEADEIEALMRRR
ncbi:MAG: aminopeptidase P N-terminal domain-containing protein [Chthoniobacter sp.]|nr:aminopeptidase P N-terminal domain-containing protein [Chthoniobacter sp.]